MIDERELFERTAARFAPPTDALDRFNRRRERRQRNRRIAAGAIAIAVVLAVAGSLGYAIRSAPADTPAPPHGGSVFAGMAGWIAYVDQRDLSGHQHHLFAADPTGSAQPARIPIGSMGAPVAWAQTGDRLLLSDGSVLHADGSRVQVFQPRIAPREASFSPDGSMIVFQGPDASLEVVSADGTGKPTSIAAPHGGGFQSPAWSPDGSQIAFLAGQGNISVVNADGADRHILTPLRGKIGEAGVLSWSPDSTALALAISPSCCDSQQGEIWVVNADGSNLRQVTPNDGSWGPSWSPDGSRIAFVRGPHVYTATREGTDVQRVPAGPVYAYQIAWNPLTPAVSAGQ